LAGEVQHVPVLAAQLWHLIGFIPRPPPAHHLCRLQYCMKHVTRDKSCGCNLGMRLTSDINNSPDTLSV